MLGEGGPQTSLLSVTLLAFDVRGPSRVPLESLSSGPHSGAVERGESRGEACWSGGRGVQVDDWGCLGRWLTERS